MNIVFVSLRRIAIGGAFVLGAFVLGAFSEAREVTLEHFKSTNGLSQPQIRLIQEFLQRLNHEPPATSGPRRLSWFRKMMSQTPAPLLELEPVVTDAGLTKILANLGRTQRIRFVDLLIARIVDEIAAADPAFRRTYVEGLLDSALSLPLDGGARITLARVVLHLLDEDYLRLTVLSVLERRPSLLDASPELWTKIFDYAVDIPRAAKRAYPSAAAFRILARRPDLIQIERFGQIDTARKTLSRMAWLSEADDGINTKLLGLIDGIRDSYVRDHAPPGRHYVIEEAFASDRVATADEAAEVRDFLEAVESSPGRRKDQRARWWISVAPRLTPFVSKLHLTNSTPALSNLFRTKKSRRGTRLGLLVIKELHSELKGVPTEWSGRRDFFRLMLIAILRMPRTDVTVPFTTALVREWLTDDLIRPVVMDVIRQNPMVLHDFPDVRAHILWLATAPASSRSDLRVILMALDVLKSRTSSLSESQLTTLATAGRKLIEARWDSSNALSRMTIRGAFEDFAAMLDNGLESGAKFLNTIRSAERTEESVGLVDQAPIDVNSAGLRIHQAEYSPTEIRQIAVFLDFAGTVPARVETDPLGLVDLWWQVLTHRVPEAMMNVEVVGVPPMLDRLLGTRHWFRPGARLGEVLINQLFEDLLVNDHARPDFVENMLKAAFDLPVHMVALNGLSHYVVALLQDRQTREKTLEVLTLHPNFLRLSAAVRDEVIHLVDHRDDAQYGPRTLVLALRALATVPKSIEADQIQKIFAASQGFEFRSWIVEEMNEVVDAVHRLAVAVNSGDAPTCTESLATSRW